MSSGLAGIHEMLGGIVVVALIVVAILAAIQAAGGNERFTRIASFVAAGLLIVQYVVGFVLMGSGLRNSNEHYLISLLALVPIALQHSVAKRYAAKTRGVAILIAAMAAAFLSVIAYATGMSGAAG